MTNIPRPLFFAFLFSPDVSLAFAISSNMNDLITVSSDDQNRLQEWLFNQAQRVVNSLLYDQPKFRYYRDDLINYAKLLVIPPEEFFKNFDFNRLNNPDYTQIYYLLTTYTKKTIKYQLFPRLRELTGDLTLGYSDLGLLARSSLREVKLSLNSSCKPTELEQYLFLFKRFREIRNSENKPINLWGEVEFQKVADRANELRTQFSQSQQIEELNGKTVKTSLNYMGKTLREHRIMNFDVRHQNLYLEPEDPYDNQRSKKLFEIVKNRLKQMNNDQKKLLILEHGLKIVHRIIAVEFNIETPAISQRLRALYNRLIKHIWDTYKVPEENRTVEQLGEIKKELKKYLDKRFEEKIDLILNINQAKLKNSNITFLINFVAKKIEEKYQINTQEVKDHVRINLEKMIDRSL